MAAVNHPRSYLYNANVHSTKRTVEIDHSSPVPLHEQVAAAVRRAIAEGEARSGERLPPARDLAAVLGVNANTVFRAGGVPPRPRGVGDRDGPAAQRGGGEGA